MDLIQIILLITLILFLVFILSFFRTPKIYTFKQEQFVKSDMETVFEFFSRPENLEKITPPAMSFNIMTPRPIEMKEGSIIDYTVKIVGIPTRWRTIITSYKKNEILDDSIHLIKTNRGGKITCHAPGQLICYFVLDLRKKKDIRN